MRVLAIDTALGACSAAVLDTDLGAVIASESTVMSRGHAEAVMPMIARVMDQAGIRDSSRSRNSACSRTTRDRPDDPVGICGAPHCRRRYQIRGRGHRRTA